MKVTDNRALRTERAAVLKEARMLSDKGQLTAAEQARFASLMERSRSLKEEIENLESGMMSEVRGGQPGLPTSTHPSGSEEAEQEYRTAFNSYLRCGLNSMPQEHRAVLETRRSTLEVRDMTGGGLGAGLAGVTSGGFVVPVGFVQDVIKTLKTTGPMLDDSVVSMMTTSSGQPLPYPAENSTAVIGERVGEGQQVTTADENLGQVLFGAYKYSSKLTKVSIELMQDSAFDFEQYLIGQFALRFGRVLNSDLTLGTGSGAQMPQGIVPAVVSNGTVITAVGSVANDGAGGANTIGSDDLTNLIHAIDPLYRPGASFMMHDTTLQAILKVKDKYGRPLLDPNVQNPAARSFMGHEIRINQYMDPIQTQLSSPPTTKNTVVFGPLKRYMVRRVQDMSVLVLRERFADLGLIGVLAFMRLDGNVLAGPGATGAQYPFSLLKNVA